MSKVTTRLLLTFLMVTVVFAGTAIASVPVSGEFTANKPCEAFQSIRKRSNPGNVRLNIGYDYPVMLLNKAKGTTWYQVRIEGAVPKDRWVYFECGSLSNITPKRKSKYSKRSSKSSGCSIAGQADSYVFAVSWQPAFCEGHPDKPECSVTSPSAFQAKNFTLHGLWPNKKACGTKYGFCGKYKKRVRPFCKFDPIKMEASTLKELGEVMPSAAHGSCLQRHEWYKHGTCQTEWDADGYFDTAMRLLKDFNSSAAATLVRNNIGKIVTTKAFLNAVDQSFGAGAHTRLRLSCSNNKLSDVYIKLPKTIPDSAKLKDLIQKAKPDFNNRCGDRFEVDPIGQ